MLYFQIILSSVFSANLSSSIFPFFTREKGILFKSPFTKELLKNMTYSPPGRLLFPTDTTSKTCFLFYVYATCSDELHPLVPPDMTYYAESMESNQRHFPRIQFASRKFYLVSPVTVHLWKQIPAWMRPRTRNT